MLKRKKAQSNKAIDKKTITAKEKYKVGEKLNFEEFKILMDRGMINKKDF